jgi:sugar/nucleoside kinase (ribokinase family)
MFVTFSIIHDDIVLADGRTCMGVLGGGGPQTCFGARLFADGKTVGICSGVGEDFDASWFAQSGIDTSGLRFSHSLPTMRAWQIIDMVDNDQRRTQVWRVPFSAVRAHLDRSIDLLPPRYQQAQAFHLGIHPDNPDVDFMRALTQLEQKPFISVEVFKGADALPTRHQLEQWLPLCDVFSANAAEVQSLGAPSNPTDAAKWLVDLGTRIAIVRLGQGGSVLFDGTRNGGRAVHVPAIAAKPVMGAVGAGNAYCGAFVLHYLQHGDLEMAGRAGAAAAKLLIEAEQLPVADDELRDVAKALLEAERLRG